MPTINSKKLISCLEKHLSRLYDALLLTKNHEVEAILMSQINYMTTITQTISSHISPEGSLSDASDGSLTPSA